MARPLWGKVLEQFSEVGLSLSNKWTYLVVAKRQGGKTIQNTTINNHVV